MSYDTVSFSDVNLITSFVFSSLCRLGYKISKDGIEKDIDEIDEIEMEIINDILKNVM